MEALERVLEHLHAGHLPAGRSVGEAALAKQLGVSRTPLREALLELERDRLVDCQPGRGFVVRPLTCDEVRDLYPMVWTLEELALRSGPTSPTLLDELEELNARFEGLRSARARFRTDAAWHARLISVAGNERLESTLTSIKRRITRYELAYMRSAEGTESSAREHNQIVSALRRSDQGRAAELLERHWRRGMQSLLDQIESQNSGELQ